MIPDGSSLLRWFPWQWTRCLVKAKRVRSISCNSFQSKTFVADILMLGRSTIIIARRLSLIRDADYIAVMEEGQLVDMETHDELLNLDDIHTELLRCEEVAKLPKRLVHPSSFSLSNWHAFFSDSML
ncbi:hypothetical protein ABZP36_008888 [Zizania latifolia]